MKCHDLVYTWLLPDAEYVWNEHVNVESVGDKQLSGNAIAFAIANAAAITMNLTLVAGRGR